MTLRRLEISQFRNIAQAQLLPGEGINLLIGENGAGKTSVLEAISVLSTGRSFRSSRTPAMIRFEQHAYTLFAEVSSALDQHQPIIPMGISRNRDNEQQIRIGGQQARSAAQLAKLLPVQTINSESFRLLEGAPKIRRQFIDWGVFHVKPAFFQVWQSAQKALKQRNKLLKYGKMGGLNQLDIWDAALAEYAVQIDQMRSEYIDLLLPEFYRVLTELSQYDPELSTTAADDVSQQSAQVYQALKLSYYRGWDRQQNYLQLLQENRVRDSQLGFTHSGPHRADLKLRIQRLSAVDVLSRGQQKQIVCALLLAQGRLMQTLNGKQSIYLIDDLPAELDHSHRASLCRVLEQMQCQAFISSVEADSITRVWSASAPLTLFHVEQGQIRKQA